MRRRDCTHTDGDAHDCDYVDALNRLIGRAERYANETVGWRSDGWTAAFTREMDRLAEEAGLRKPGPGRNGAAIIPFSGGKKAAA